MMRRGEPYAITVNRVAGDLFGVWGLRMQLGRGLQPGDDAPGAPRVAVLADYYWRQMFAASPNVIGETVTIDSVPHAIAATVIACATVWRRRTARGDAALAALQHEVRSGDVLRAPSSGFELGAFTGAAAVLGLEAMPDALHPWLKEFRSASQAGSSGGGCGSGGSGCGSGGDGGGGGGGGCGGCGGGGCGGD